MLCYTLFLQLCMGARPNDRAQIMLGDLLCVCVCVSLWLANVPDSNLINVTQRSWLRGDLIILLPNLKDNKVLPAFSTTAV